VAGAESAEAKAFRLYAALPHTPLNEADLGAEFTSRGTTYRITGFNRRARKMPIQATRVSDGASFKFPTEIVTAALGR
jgi:hypothetical protein